jgi:hypothetical protein
MTKRLGPILLAVAAALSVPVASSAVEIRLTNGDVIQAISVEPAPFDMVRITMPDGTHDYLAPVKIRAVIDDTGADRTKALFRDHETVGTSLRSEPRAPGPGLRVGPRSVTHHFMITETTLIGRMDSPSGGGSLDFDMGVMWNVGDRDALGGTLFLGGGDPYDDHVGLRFRYRRWISRTASLEVAPGVIALSNSDRGSFTPGYTLQLAVNPSRYLGLVTEVFTIERRGDSPYYFYANPRPASSEVTRDTGLMGGVRIGQWPGAVTGFALLVAWLGLSSIPATP